MGVLIKNLEKSILGKSEKDKLKPTDIRENNIHIYALLVACSLMHGDQLGDPSQAPSWDTRVLLVGHCFRLAHLDSSQKLLPVGGDHCICVVSRWLGSVLWLLGFLFRAVCYHYHLCWEFLNKGQEHGKSRDWKLWLASLVPLRQCLEGGEPGSVICSSRGSLISSIPFLSHETQSQKFRGTLEASEQYLQMLFSRSVTSLSIPGRKMPLFFRSVLNQHLWRMFSWGELLNSWILFGSVGFIMK